MATPRATGLFFPLLLMLVPLAERVVHEVRAHDALAGLRPRSGASVAPSRGAPAQPARPARSDPSPSDPSPSGTSSGVAPQPSQPVTAAEAAALGAALVVPLEGPRVILAADAPRAWARGEPRLRGDGYFGWSELELDGSTAASDLLRLGGAQVVLFGAEGEVCRGTLESPTIVTPLFADPIDLLGGEDLDGLLDQGEGDVDPRQEARLRAEHGASWVASAVRVDSGECAGALWARSAHLPAPVILRPAGPWSAAQRRSAWRAARSAGSGVEEGLPELDELFAGDEPAVQVRGRRWRGPTGRLRRTVGRFEDLRGPCEGGDPRLDPMWIVGEDASVVRGPERWAPLALFDSDRDGRVEIVLGRPGTADDPQAHAERALAREDVKGRPALAQVLEIPLVGCPC